MKVPKLDTLQFYVSSNIALHPILHKHYLHQLHLLHLQNKLCLLPHTILELENNKIKSK